MASQYDNQTSDVMEDALGVAGPQVGPATSNYASENLFSDQPDTLNQTTFKSPSPYASGPSDPFSTFSNGAVNPKND